MKRQHPHPSNVAGHRPQRPVYPFAAIVGQDEMKLALLLNVIEPAIGGVLIMGHRGSGKSTAVRALADLLPQISKVKDCAYACDPLDASNFCDDCLARLDKNERLGRVRSAVPVVDLPLGATEDRVSGTINIERALTTGVKAFEPGLLARANRGFLYIDEVNLLEDHLIDLLLDVAVTGRNTVEREGISIEHPARFVLVGSGNPEEGELRPQLQDRFGLHVEVRTEIDLDHRVLIVERREAFDRDPENFCAQVEKEQERLRRRLLNARKRLPLVQLPRQLLRRIAGLCLQLKIDGHRGELTISRSAHALAAFEGRRVVTADDVRRVAAMSLRHRLRRDPLEQTASASRIEQQLEEIFPSQKNAETERDALSEGDQDKPSKPKQGGGGDHNSNGGSAHHESGEDGKQNSRTQSAPLNFSPPLPEIADDLSNLSSTTRASSRTAQRQSSAHTIYTHTRGRYARAVNKKSDGSRIALDATLRSASAGDRSLRTWVGETKTEAANKSSALTPNLHSPSPVRVGELRYKLLKRKMGGLFIFAVDTSGSMALNRIGQAKGALVHLLEKSYIRRDRVALVSFREHEAALLLPPSRSVSRARRILDALPVGGATPLAAGLMCALETTRRAAMQGAQKIILLLFTDGRANVSLCANEIADRRARQRIIAREIEQLGATLFQAGAKLVVVDTQNRFTSNGEAQALAHKLRAEYVRLPLMEKASGQASIFNQGMNL